MTSLWLHSAGFRVRHVAVAHKFPLTTANSYPPLLTLTSDFLAEREVYT